jgi:hypothetical protein
MFSRRSKKMLEEERDERRKMEEAHAAQMLKLQKQQHLMAKAKEEELQRRERLERELAKQRWKENAERQRMEQLHEDQLMEAVRQLELARVAEQTLSRKEEERREMMAEKQRVEEERLEREARQRREKRRRLKEASPDTLRSLRELIRDKYRLDVEIWSLRGARKPDRWIVEQKMEKADAVLNEIMETVELWKDNHDGSWDSAEWKRVQDIRKRLQSGGIRIWADDPLWGQPG